jgi:hypothetical protein
MNATPPGAIFSKSKFEHFAPFLQGGLLEQSDETTFAEK